MSLCRPLQEYFQVASDPVEVTVGAPPAAPPTVAAGLATALGPVALGLLALFLAPLWEG